MFDYQRVMDPGSKARTKSRLKLSPWCVSMTFSGKTTQLEGLFHQCSRFYHSQRFFTLGDCQPKPLKRSINKSLKRGSPLRHLKAGWASPTSRCFSGKISEKLRSETINQQTKWVLCLLPGLSSGRYLQVLWCSSSVDAEVHNWGKCGLALGNTSCL